MQLMKTFHCDHCGALVFFENVTCLTCGHALGFLPDIMDLAALEQVQQDQWQSLAAESAGRLYRPCANGRIYAVCNWMVPVDDPEELCVACRMNAVIPDLSITANIAAWHKMEVAKRRLIYTLRLLSLSTDGFSDKWWPRLQFCFLTDVPGAAPILTGHDGGVITMNIDEADDVERFKRRTEFHEPHPTLIGHFRHESGHYFWDALIAGSP